MPRPSKILRETFMEQYIDVIYENSTARAGTATVHWLSEAGIGRQTDPEKRWPSGLVCHRFTALRPIAKNSAIIFVSDEATANIDWQTCINDLPGDTRIIPAGRTENVDYNDPNVIPPRIEEINFIRLDGSEYVNFLDSLITDPDFYPLKNLLVMRSAAYRAGHFEGNLLTSKKDIRDYRRKVKSNLAGKSDPSLVRQLTDILEYLDTSEKYASMLARKNFIRWTFRGILVAAAVLLLVFFYRLAPYYRRISSSSPLISADPDAMDPSTAAIRMVEVILNPFSEDVTKKIAYSRLIEFLDMPWAQTPVGMNYIPELGGVAIPAGSQYVWTSTSYGTVLLWDTYTGQIISESELTDKSLYDIAIWEDSLFVIDAEGQIYGGDGTAWHSAGTAASITPASAALQCSEDSLLLYDKDSVALMDTSDHVSVILPEQANRQVLTAGFSADGPVAACAEDGKLTIYLFGSRIPQIQETDAASDKGGQPSDSLGDKAERIDVKNISVDSHSCADIRNGRLVITDTDGQVWLYADNQIRRTALYLPIAIDLAFVTDDIVVYHERNRGTGLYDLLSEYDYGDVLYSFSAVMEIRASDELLLLNMSYGWIPVALSDLLPASSSDTEHAAASWKGSHAECDLSESEGRGIKSADIAENGVLKVKMFLGDTDSPENAESSAYRESSISETDVIFDPARNLRNSSGHAEDSALSEDYSYYDDEPFFIKGILTTVGIRYVPANPLNKSDYFYLLCGASDGSFTELGVDPNTGLTIRTFYHTIPSRSPITEIYQTDTGYLLRDKNGTLWHSGSGINIVTNKGVTEAVKAKLRAAVTDRMAEIISDDVWTALDLQKHPGGDGKRWE